MKKIIKLSCPACKETMQWDKKNPYRPFCSERCQLIDFGAWANEDYQIPGDDGDAGSDENGH